MQLLGFPLQLVGILALPWAYVKYVDESNSIVDDIGSAAVRYCSSASQCDCDTDPTATPHCLTASFLHLVMLSMFLNKFVTARHQRGQWILTNFSKVSHAAVQKKVTNKLPGLE